MQPVTGGMRDVVREAVHGLVAAREREGRARVENDHAARPWSGRVISRPERIFSAAIA